MSEPTNICQSLGIGLLVTFAVGLITGFNFGFVWRRHWDDWCSSLMEKLTKTALREPRR